MNIERSNSLLPVISWLLLHKDKADQKVNDSVGREREKAGQECGRAIMTAYCRDVRICRDKADQKANDSVGRERERAGQERGHHTMAAYLFSDPHDTMAAYRFSDPPRLIIQNNMPTMGSKRYLAEALDSVNTWNLIDPKHSIGTFRSLNSD